MLGAIRAPEGRQQIQLLPATCSAITYVLLFPCETFDLLLRMFTPFALSNME